MKEEYKKAFSEVSNIISMMPEELKVNIPQSFIILIEKEKSSTYKPKIKEPIEEQELMEETVIILGLIYRDFLCSKEEKIKLQEQDAISEKELEEKLSKQYSIENIFEKKKRHQEEIKQEADKMTIYQEIWYHKLWSVIKRIFKK